MPCRDISDEEYARHDRQERDNLAAALCAVLSVMEKNMPANTFNQYINTIDWKEAGITKKWLTTWWTKHKAKDAERRAYEAKERAKKERIKHLREKMNLTEEEWSLLKEGFHSDFMKW
jgi:hypothetical protein